MCVFHACYSRNHRTPGRKKPDSQQLHLLSFARNITMSSAASMKCLAPKPSRELSPRSAVVAQRNREQAGRRVPSPHIPQAGPVPSHHIPESTSWDWAVEEGEEDCSAPESGGAIPSQGSQERSLPLETTIHWDLLFFFFKQSFSPPTPPPCQG